MAYDPIEFDKNYCLNLLIGSSSLSLFIKLKYTTFFLNYDWSISVLKYFFLEGGGDRQIPGYMALLFQCFNVSGFRGPLFNQSCIY